LKASPQKSLKYLSRTCIRKAYFPPKPWRN